MNQSLQLNATIKTCDLHAKRLKFAMHKLKPLIPISAVRFAQISDDEVLFFELFTSRFGKLQDLMGAKLFSLVLNFSNEPGQFETFIDKLNMLERLGCISDAKSWLEFRDMRNHLSHEYPDNPEISSKNINIAFGMSEILLNILDKIKTFVKKIEAQY